MECELCGKSDVDTYLLLPANFIECCNYHRCNLYNSIIPLCGDSNENVLHLCVECSNKLNEQIVLPNNELSYLLKLLSKEKLNSYCLFLIKYKKPILSFLSETCIMYSEELDMFLTNMGSMNLCRDFREFYDMVDLIRKE